MAFSRSYLGQGNGKIWLSEPRCSGDEEWLGQCPSTVFQTPFCTHREDVSVFCYDEVSSIIISIEEGVQVMREYTVGFLYV